MRRVAIRSLDAEGHGFAAIDGHLVAVPGTLPGEVVDVRLPITARGEAALADVLHAAPERVVPRCSHTQECGGCAWQHVAYAHQLRLKRERVQYLLDSELGPGAVRVAPTIPTPCEDGAAAPWHFRHKVHFALDSAPGGGVLMGHLARGSHCVVEVDECPVHVEAGNAVAQDVRRVLVEGRIRCGPPPAGLVRHIVCRVGRASGDVLATIVATQPHASLDRVTRGVMASAGAPAGVSVNVNPRPGPMLFGPETLHVAGLERLEERMGGVTYRLSPTAFFQTNLAAADALLALVLGALPPAPAHVLDLYAGLGLFALPAARAGHRVVAVEENPVAAADGVESAAANGIGDRCRFVRTKVEYGLARLTNTRPPFDVVVLDPPRAGASRAVLFRISEELSPARIVYVSCDPESLARDLRELTGAPGGRRAYRVTSVQPVDMFPHTTHVEAVAVLDRA